MLTRQRRESRPLANDLAYLPQWANALPPGATLLPFRRYPPRQFLHYVRCADAPVLRRVGRRIWPERCDCDAYRETAPRRTLSLNSATMIRNGCSHRSSTQERQLEETKTCSRTLMTYGRKS